jgi:carboxyl-terminal processing protease
MHKQFSGFALPGLPAVLKWVNFLTVMRLRTAILSFALAWSCAAAGKTTLTAEQRKLNLESFEYVWTTVRDKHWDPKLGGLDWQAVHDELRPAIEKAATADDAREVMSSMLQRLHQTHFGIVPADVYGEMKGSEKDKDNDRADNGEGDPGIDLRVIDGRALVTGVAAGSPAAIVGIKPGWEIVKIDGKELAKSIARIDRKMSDSTLHDFTLMRAMEERLVGDVGTQVKLEFHDGSGHRVERTLERIKPRGAVAHLGNLPPLHFWVEQRKLRPEVGYLRFNMFFEPDALMSAVSALMKDCTGCRGIVIDLRGNPGGIGGLAVGLAGWFTDHAGTQLGTMYTRTAQIRFALFARPNPFLGVLAVLVDGCSASTSEIFAGGLQDLKRARIFGTRTAGAALPSVVERLPNGDGFQYAFANYISHGGKPLEGAGVTPDEEVKLSRRVLLDGHDSVLDRALAWIQSSKN